jgi:hypothetical protein
LKPVLLLVDAQRVGDAAVVEHHGLGRAEDRRAHLRAFDVLAAPRLVAVVQGHQEARRAQQAVAGVHAADGAVGADVAGVGVAHHQPVIADGERLEARLYSNPPALRTRTPVACM